MRSHLIDALNFSWDAISPAIFGSLFQSVMNPKERRSQGAHYTTERNILKVIEPLFLDELRDEFKRLTERRDSGRRKASSQPRRVARVPARRDADVLHPQHPLDRGPLAEIVSFGAVADPL